MYSKKLLFIKLSLLLINYSVAQNLSSFNNEEQNGCIWTNHDGEYEWVFYPGNFKWFDNIWTYDGNSWNRDGIWHEDMEISWAIKVVSFPFVVDENMQSGNWQNNNSLKRKFKLPPPSWPLVPGEKYSNIYSIFGNELTLSRHESFGLPQEYTMDNRNGALNNFYPFYNVNAPSPGFGMDECIIGSNPHGPPIQFRIPNALISYYSAYDLVVLTGHAPFQRKTFPHTALKHVIYLHCGPSIEDPIIDSIYYIVDHTWENNRYPWTYGVMDGGDGSAPRHDIVYSIGVAEPEYAIFQQTYKQVDDNEFYQFKLENFFDPTFNPAYGNKYLTNSFSTFNHFENVEYNQFLCEGSNSETKPLNDYFNGQSTIGFTGYYKESLPLFYGNWMNTAACLPDEGVIHQYTIDQSIDISLINSDEKKIYNPSNVIVDVNGVLTFPSKYSFITTLDFDQDQSFFPTVAEFDDAVDFFADWEIYFDDPKDVPLPANRISNYVLESNSEIFFDDCVRIFDAQFDFKNSSTTNSKISYNSDNLIQRNLILPNPSNLPPGQVVEDRVQSMTCDERTNIPCGYTFENYYSIQTNTTWEDKNYSFFKLLRIESGKTLTLKNCDLKFGNIDATGFPSGIFIEGGAKLILDNGTVLTSKINCGYWDGIKILGNNNYDQSSQYQGKLEMYNGSKIENAKLAVNAGNNNIGGGIVLVVDSYFKNNFLDFYFGPYLNHPSSSKIIDCAFTSTLSSTRYGSSKEFFIENKEHNKPLVVGTNFNGSYECNGIKNRGGSIHIGGCTFTEVLTALEAFDYNGNNPTSIFYSNVIGITGQSTVGVISENGVDDQIDKNTISVISNDPLTAIKKIDGSQGSISSNTITCVYCPADVAINIDGTSDIEYLNKNIISGFGIGLQLSGINNYEVLCNEFQEYTIGIFVPDDQPWELFGSTSLPAFNEFLDNCSPGSGEYDIFVGARTSSAPKMTYYYTVSNPNPPNVNCVEENGNTIKLISVTYDEDACASAGGGADPNDPGDPDQ
jgi:hypothetical protein